MEFVDGKISTQIGRPLTQQHPRIVVEDDAIRRAITGDRFNFSSESQVYAIKYGMIRTLMEQGYEVLVDDTHTSPPSIQRLLEINIRADFVFIDTDLRECMTRAITTDQSDLIEVIRRHHFNLCHLIGQKTSLYMPDDAVERIAEAVRTIRGGVVERMEHTKRV